MHVKEITRPDVRETFFYGKIISWKFNDSIVYLKSRKKYCYRVTFTFESGNQVDYQKGGFDTKAEASKAREIVIAQLYNTFMSYQNIIYNYLIKAIGNKYLRDLKSDDFIKGLDTIKSPDMLRVAYGVLSGSFKYARINGYVSNNLVDSAITLHKAPKRGTRREYAKKQ